MASNEDRRKRDEQLAYEMIMHQNGQGPFPEIKDEADAETCLQLARIHLLLTEAGTRNSQLPSVPPKTEVVVLPRATPLPTKAPAAARSIPWLLSAIALIFIAYALFQDSRDLNDLDDLTAARMSALEAKVQAEISRSEFHKKLPNPGAAALAFAESAENSMVEANEEFQTGDASFEKRDTPTELTQAEIKEARKAYTQATAFFQAASNNFVKASGLESAPEVIVSANFLITIFDDDKEAGEVVVRLRQGEAVVGTWGYGSGEDWDDPGSRSFSVTGLSIPLSEAAIGVVASLEERPGQVNIDAGLEFQVQFQTDRGRTIRFSGRKYFETGNGETTLTLQQI